jgi:phospholipid/cholesterol/gamma-HCH transport system substrate-binding protein
MKQRSLEVRVGALILVAVAMLGAFVVVMGGLSFEPTYTVYVSFQNPGGLAEGAPVRISGVRVGRVDELEFRGGLDRRAGEPDAIIRAVAKIERRYQSSIHDNSRWFVSAQGVLGEMFLAVDPGSPDRPVLEDGAVVRGISPPRLDLLLSESYELLHGAYRAFTENEQKISETFDGLHRTLGASGDFLEKNGPKLQRVVDNVETLSVDAQATMKAARERYVDGPQVVRIMNDVERSAHVLSQNIEPLVSDGKVVLGDAKRLTQALAKDEQLSRYEAVTRDLVAAAKGARTLTGDAQQMLERVKSGKGTAGALLSDEALYDDISELVRDLKHNPWKILWKQ